VPHLRGHTQQPAEVLPGIPEHKLQDDQKMDLIPAPMGPTPNKIHKKGSHFIKQ
jgi:hypothetical protein